MTVQRVALRHKMEMLRRRKRHIGKKLLGTPERPRLLVYRSNRHIFAQLRDDINDKTIMGCSSLTPDLLKEVKKASGKIAKAELVGRRIASMAIEKGIKQVAFDRNGRMYHGRVKALAEGARAGGLKL
jgi:large subunit ribosomal protein L18